ncbi:MAG: CoA-binding protein, partial [Pseudomonadota bacterium]
MRPLREVINSRSLVIIGASRNPSKPGAQLIKTLKASDFKGPLAGVNPQGGELDGVKFYRSVGDVPFEVDLAVLVIPPESVPAAVAECAQRGVKGVVISSEGFAEAGPAGREYQDQVKDILHQSGMRGFGPNTLGLVNTETGLTTSYIAEPDMLKPGSIGFAAQSGIFVGAFLRYLSSIEGLGLSKGLGLGNKVDVDECDALDFFAEDQQTRLVGLYLE